MLQYHLPLRRIAHAVEFPPCLGKTGSGCNPFGLCGRGESTRILTRRNPLRLANFLDPRMVSLQPVPKELLVTKVQRSSPRHLEMIAGPIRLKIADGEQPVYLRVRLGQLIANNPDRSVVVHFCSFQRSGRNGFLRLQLPAQSLRFLLPFPALY